MKKKRVLVTASTFPRWKDDTEPRFVLDLCEALTEYYDVTVLVPAAPGALDREKIGNVRVIRYHYFPIHKWENLCYPGAIVPRIKERKIRILLVPFLIFSLYFQLFKRLKDYDLVHAHWIIPQGIVQSMFKKPFIVTGHGGDVTSLNVPILRKIKEKCLKKASYVTVVSDFLKKEVELICKVENIAVEPMGCNTTTFCSSIYRQQNYFGQNEKKVVLFVGRLAEKKGVTYLIEAMKKVDAVLVIVGKGPLENELRQQAEAMGERILFLGAKTHEELKTIYASADVFAVPSVTARDGDKEGVPTVIVEAMASGLPVVATRHSGIPELIRDGENGFLVAEKDVDKLAESINKLLKDEKLAAQFIEEGKKTAEYYDYKEIAKRYEKIYSQVILESYNEKTT